MASYTLIGSASIVQVLSPTVVEDKVAVTIQTHPTGIVATDLVKQATFADGSASQELTVFADNIEAIIAQGKAVGGSGTSALEASGLTKYYVTFEVGYNPPGAPTGTVTVDVDVPVSMLSGTGYGGGSIGFGKAVALVDTAYANLVALSGNAPASGTTAGATTAPPPAPAATV